MAELLKKPISVSHIFAVPGPREAPFTFKRFSEIMPDLKTIPWDTIRQVAQFDLSVMEDRARSGTLLFIVKDRDELMLPRGWLNILVYDLHNAIILVRNQQLILWHEGLRSGSQFEYDTATLFAHRNGRKIKGETFLRSTFAAAPVTHPARQPALAIP